MSRQSVFSTSHFSSCFIPHVKVPFNILPDECLLLILEFCGGCPFTKLNLIKVCRRWRNLASKPILWRYVNVSLQRNKLPLFFKLMAMPKAQYIHSLEICYDDCSDFNQIACDSKLFNEFPHLPNLRHLYLARMPLPIVRRLAETMTNLISFWCECIQFASSDPVDREVDFSAFGRMKALEHLCIHSDEECFLLGPALYHHDRNADDANLPSLKTSKISIISYERSTYFHTSADEYYSQWQFALNLSRISSICGGDSRGWTERHWRACLGNKLPVIMTFISLTGLNPESDCFDTIGECFSRFTSVRHLEFVDFYISDEIINGLSSLAVERLDFAPKWEPVRRGHRKFTGESYQEQYEHLKYRWGNIISLVQVLSRHGGLRQVYWRVNARWREDFMGFLNWLARSMLVGDENSKLARWECGPTIKILHTDKIDIKFVYRARI